MQEEIVKFKELLFKVIMGEGRLQILVVNHPKGEQRIGNVGYKLRGWGRELHFSGGSFEIKREWLGLNKKEAAELEKEILSATARAIKREYPHIREVAGGMVAMHRRRQQNVFVQLSRAMAPKKPPRKPR